MSNVVSLVRGEAPVNESLLENTKILLEKIEAGEVVQLACVARLKDGSIFTLTPSNENRFQMLGAIHHLATMYAQQAIE